MQALVLAILVAAALVPALGFRELFPLLTRCMCHVHARRTGLVICASSMAAIVAIAFGLPLSGGALPLVVANLVLLTCLATTGVAWAMVPPIGRPGPFRLLRRVGIPALAGVGMILAVTFILQPAGWQLL